MKSIIQRLKTIGIALSLVFVLGSFVNYTSTSSSNTFETYDCKYGQCLATAKSTGKRCKHCVSNRGDKYCWQHKQK